ncbi:MAG: hypothetical protein AAF539_00845 [Planctomycetota bacterium]
MSHISSAIRPVLQAQQDATRTKIDIALLGQSLDSQREIGDAVNQLIQDVADLQKQLRGGHIDVRV